MSASTEAKNKFFELPTGNEVLEECKQKLAGGVLSKYLAAHYQKVEAVKKDLKRLPERDEFFFLQSDNSFNAFTFIPFVLENKSARRLLCTTYSINKRVITALMELHQGGLVDEITLLVSDTMLKRNPVTADLLAAVSREHANINVLFAWVHAKVCLLDTGADHYVIEGSGNWSDNAYYEQYTFANSRDLFRFREKLFTETQIRYRITNGEILEVTKH